MARLSNCVVGSLNILTLIASIALMVFSFFLKSTDCQSLFQVPLLILGGCLCIVSLLGLFGSFCRVTLFSFIYQFILCASILGLLAFTIFSLIVTNKAAGVALSGVGYEQHRLGDYSNWLQKRVGSAPNWEKIKNCVIDAHVCQGNNNVPTGFSPKLLVSIQSGCCEAPVNCDRSSSTSAPDPDCNLWSNDRDRLCYDCASCKVGFLSSMRSHWRKIALVHVGALALLIIISCFACCAHRNNTKCNRRRRSDCRGDPMHITERL